MDQVLARQDSALHRASKVKAVAFQRPHVQPSANNRQRAASSMNETWRRRLQWDRLMRAHRVGCMIYSETGSMLRTTKYVTKLVRSKFRLFLAHQSDLGRANDIRADIVRARSENDGPLSVAARVSGGIGDYIVIARFLRDALARIPDIVLDVYASAPEAARFAFSSLPMLRDVFADSLFDLLSDEYDLGLSLNQLAIVHGDRARWSRLRQSLPMMEVCESIIRYRQKVDALIMHHPRLDNAVGQHAAFSNARRRDFLHRMAQVRYGGDTFPLPCATDALQRFGLSDRPYVTVHNGFDTGFVISGDRATKCYPHFDALVGNLKKARPDLTLVQIGTRTSVPIPTVDLSLLQKTSLTDVVALLRGAQLHIDGESGVVHMASCVGTPSAVLFGPTPIEYFGYPDNLNIEPARCGGCWWITETWMDHCPRGFAEPPCLAEIRPEHAVSRILSFLEARQIAGACGLSQPAGSPCLPDFVRD
jgi:ADP-heptose:LPS heptosyltransferase